tara:strand:- start:287 stop:526 length:240 start_codon:yes stop_codon:yes gene_type:complete
LANQFPFVLDPRGDAPGFVEDGRWPTKPNANAQRQKALARDRVPLQRACESLDHPLHTRKTNQKSRSLESSGERLSLWF